ncbi:MULTISPECIES: hypothetical protein [unclassified Pseudoalteromonas]|uniref:hypothetical protein n=1 Tax=unclassified Pseudoalteromonas TaxID=194690 RepID=UPI0005A9D124|nr:MULTISPECIES: hypothetical protein [unclassified Pseudoalteromonas]
MKKLILGCIFLAPVFSSAAGFDEIIQTCSSLNTFNNMYTTCLNNGFSYPRIDVQYSSSNNGVVEFSIKQAKMGGSVVDHHVTSAIRVKSTEISISPAIQNAIDGLTSAANSGEIKTKPKGATGFVSSLVRDIFVGASGSLTADWSKNVLSNKASASNADSPLIIITDEASRPLGSGYINDGKLMTNVRLTTDKNGNHSWTGTTSFGEGVKIVNNWGGFKGGGTTCKVTYTGTEDEMVTNVICYRD